jgi:hypothetical protein
MTATEQLRVGFSNAGGGGRNPHLELFQSLVPEGVTLEFEGLHVLDESTDDFDIRYDLHGNLKPLLDKAAQLVAERGWNALIVPAAPLEVMNPGLYDGLRGALRVPVTTALYACSAALRAFDASRILLMTPFTERMNARIRDYLAGRGIESSTFGEFDRVAEASILGPDQVRQRARAALESAGRVDAIYFQGAVLDPLKVIETLEQDTELPVVASNPAMLWFILSQLGRRYSIEGYGKLLRQWPAVPA